MWQKAAPLSVDAEQRKVLEGWVRGHDTATSLVVRSKIVLAAAEGHSNNRISKDLGVNRPTVIRWRRRFEEGGPAALGKIAPGRGRKPSIGPERVAAIIEATLNTLPEAATHWSCRTMAKAAGISPDTVGRIWRAHNLQPHRTRTFKQSTDKQFIEKLTDVVGLYLNPPEKAIVLCVDEKSQIQALDRTQPGLPMVRGRCGTMTHDYKRNGTTTLFAALNMADGTVVGDCLPRHRHDEFLRFLRRLDREFPASLDLHLIVDNYATHKHADVITWLGKHKRFHLHFTPTSTSWLNLIECWFAQLTNKRIRRGVFPSVPALIAAINEFVEVHNRDPKPFVWTASVQDILDKLAHCPSIPRTNH
jgi:transposase/transposase-like protein